MSLKAHTLQGPLAYVRTLVYTHMHARQSSLVLWKINNLLHILVEYEQDNDDRFSTITWPQKHPFMKQTHCNVSQ